MTPFDLRVSPKTVQHQSVEKLREAIVTGVFKPGDRLVEAELCKMLGVSRPSIREALRSLEAERLVVMIPNRGPQIPILSWQEATEIYQVRALLEGEAAALATRHATPADCKRMRTILTAFGKAVRANDSDAQLSVTVELYDEILRLCGNKIIKETLHGLHVRINFLRGRSMSRPGRAKNSHQEMKAIVKAIEAGDEEGARRAAIEHVEQAYFSARTAYELDQPGVISKAVP